ncbi:MAG: hypothetical protein NC350_01140 [Corallococcus sp.]|nr:hypothetical protein [Corallococcus sp.]
MQEYWERALEVIEENFTGCTPCAVAACGDDGVDMRSAHIYYRDGKAYFITHDYSDFLKIIDKQGKVAICFNASRLYGHAKPIGHPLDKDNLPLRTRIKRDFSDVYCSFVNENDNSICLVEVTVDRAVVFTKFHKYDVNLHTEELLRERHYGHLSVEI